MEEAKFTWEARRVFSFPTCFNSTPPTSAMNEVALSTQLKPVWIQDKNTGHGYALAAPGGLWTLIFAIGRLENLTFLI